VASYWWLKYRVMRGYLEIKKQVLL
jgi:hypothetical protein